MVSRIRPATTAEKQEYADWERHHEERIAKWERETYERLKEKFDG